MRIQRIHFYEVLIMVMGTTESFQQWELGLFLFLL